MRDLYIRARLMSVFLSVMTVVDAGDSDILTTTA